MKYNGDIYDYIKNDIKGKLVFDIGSNIGMMSKRFVDFGCKCISVEPQKELINNDNYKGVFSIKNSCIDNKIGKTSFFKCSKNTSSSCRKDWQIHHPEKNWEKIELNTITIDSLIEEFGIPKFIKLDVEGYEHKALQGLSEKVDIISFEFTDGFIDSTKECIQILSKLGMKKFMTFDKKKDKKIINGKKETLRIYSIVNEYNHISDLFNYLHNLPKLNKKFQGDILTLS